MSHEALKISMTGKTSFWIELRLRSSSCLATNRPARWPSRAKSNPTPPPREFVSMRCEKAVDFNSPYLLLHFYFQTVIFSLLEEEHRIRKWLSGENLSKKTGCASASSVAKFFSSEICFLRHRYSWVKSKKFRFGRVVFNNGRPFRSFISCEVIFLSFPIFYKVFQEHCGARKQDKSSGAFRMWELRGNTMRFLCSIQRSMWREHIGLHT